MLTGSTPEQMWTELTLCSVYGPQVDRATHPSGWGYDWVDHVPLADAEALPWQGEA